MGWRWIKEEEKSMLGLWAKRGVAAEGAMEGAGKAMLVSYLFDFILFKLGKFVL